MKSDNQHKRSQHILGAEDIELSAQPLDESKSAIAVAERKRIKSMVLTAGIALFIVVAVLVVGAISGSITQKDAAAQEPRESTPTFYGSLDDEDLKEEKIVSMIAEAYYTVENGMMVTVGFSNNLDTDEHISRVVVEICTEKGAEIAKAQSASMSEDFVVAAGDAKEVTLYIKPEYVSITDDPLQTLSYEITIDHETVE